jgi:hypothetical protein
MVETFEQFHARVVANAEYYTAVRFLGRAQWLREERPTFEAALAAAKDMNTDPHRGVLVYAVYRTHQALCAVLNPKVKGMTMIGVIIQHNLDKKFQVVQINHESEIDRVKRDFGTDDVTYTVVQASSDLDNFSLQDLAKLNNILSQHQVKSFGNKEKAITRVHGLLTGKPWDAALDDAEASASDKPAAAGDAAAAPADTTGQAADTAQPDTTQENDDMARAATTGKAPKGRKPATSKARAATPKKTAGKDTTKQAAKTPSISPKTKVTRAAVAAIAARNGTKPEAQPTARGKYKDDDIIVINTEGGANPKREGTKAYDWFATTMQVAKLKKPTIAEAIKRGVPRTDLVWNAKHEFIKIRPA